MHAICQGLRLVDIREGEASRQQAVETPVEPKPVDMAPVTSVHCGWKAAKDARESRSVGDLHAACFLQQPAEGLSVSDELLQAISYSGKVLHQISFSISKASAIAKR